MLNEIIANPDADWNGDGEVNERDRGVEVCNFSASRINFDDEYYLMFNGLESDRFNGIAQPGECFMVWYELSGEKFRPMPTGGDVRLVGVNGLVDAFKYPAAPLGACIGRYPDGGSWDWLTRCSPGRYNTYWTIYPTPTPRAAATATPTP